MAVTLELRKTEWPKREFHGTPREASEERKAWRTQLQELEVGSSYEFDIETGSDDPDEQRKAVGRAVQKIKSAAGDVGVAIKLAHTSPNTLQIEDGVATIVIKRVEDGESSSDEQTAAWPGDADAE